MIQYTMNLLIAASPSPSAYASLRHLPRKRGEDDKPCVNFICVFGAVRQSCAP